MFKHFTEVETVEKLILKMDLSPIPTNLGVGVGQHQHTTPRPFPSVNPLNFQHQPPSRPPAPTMSTPATKQRSNNLVSIPLDGSGRPSTSQQQQGQKKLKEGEKKQSNQNIAPLMSLEVPDLGPGPGFFPPFPFPRMCPPGLVPTPFFPFPHPGMMVPPRGRRSKKKKKSKNISLINNLNRNSQKSSSDANASQAKTVSTEVAKNDPKNVQQLQQQQQQRQQHSQHQKTKSLAEQVAATNVRSVASVGKASGQVASAATTSGNIQPTNSNVSQIARNFQQPMKRNVDQSSRNVQQTNKRPHQSPAVYDTLQSDLSTIEEVHKTARKKNWVAHFIFLEPADLEFR